MKQQGLGSYRGLLMGSGHTMCGQVLQLHIPEALFPHPDPAYISFVFIRVFYYYLSTYF